MELNVVGYNPFHSCILIPGKYNPNIDIALHPHANDVCINDEKWKYTFMDRYQWNGLCSKMEINDEITGNEYKFGAGRNALSVALIRGIQCHEEFQWNIMNVDWCDLSMWYQQ